MESPQQLDQAVASLEPRQETKSKRARPFKLPAPSLGRRKASAPQQAASEPPPEPVRADEQARADQAREEQNDAPPAEAAPEFAEDARTVPGVVVSNLDQSEVATGDREQAEGFANDDADAGDGAQPELVAQRDAAAPEPLADADPVQAEAPADDAPGEAELVEETVAEQAKRELFIPDPKPASTAFDRPAEPGQVDVSISPLRGTRVDEDHLVLHRTVSVGELTWSQGLVLKVSELVAYVQQEALGEELATFVDLRWGALRAHGPLEPTARQTFRFSHRFEEPFTSLSTTALLRRLPPDGPDAQLWVMALALALSLVALLGFAALYRMVAVVVHFAERRSNFVAAVSHELKTPLTAIRMYGEILREDMVPSEAKRQEYYGTITAEAERLSRLIDNVLELSRLEKGTRSMHITVGSIQPVIDEVVRILRPHARNQGFAIEVELDEKLPSVAFDRDALQQILINLVDNALKFARNAEDKTVNLACELVGDELLLRVRDHGPGMPAVQVGKIFQPFFRGERELTRSTKGTGIGLALVQGLAQEMGGRVTARNHPSGGFEVSITLAPAV